MPLVTVVAAVVERDGRYLVARRPPGGHLGGYWEFPGGKCEPGEALEACLRRELLEELGVASTIGREILAVEHAYQDRIVKLHFFACVIEGEPRPALNQELRWVSPRELEKLPLPPADAELIGMLVRPSDG